MWLLVGAITTQYFHTDIFTSQFNHGKFIIFIVLHFQINENTSGLMYNNSKTNKGR